MRVNPIPTSDQVTTAAKNAGIMHPWLPQEFIASGLKWWFAQDLSSNYAHEFVLKNPLSVLEAYWNAQVLRGNDVVDQPKNYWHVRLRAHATEQAARLVEGKQRPSWQALAVSAAAAPFVSDGVKTKHWPLNVLSLHDLYYKMSKRAAILAKERGISTELLDGLGNQKRKSSLKIPKRKALKLEAVKDVIVAAINKEKRQGQTRTFTPTDEQAAAINAVGKGTPVVALHAFAGTGKTATAELIIKRLNDLHPNEQVAYLVFNKSMRKVAEERLGNVAANISTIHAYTRNKMPEKFKRVPGWKKPGSLTSGKIINHLISQSKLTNPYNIYTKNLTDHESKSKRSALFQQNQDIGDIIQASFSTWCKSAEKSISIRSVIKCVEKMNDRRRQIKLSVNDYAFILDEVRNLWQEMLDCKRPMGHDQYLKYFQVNHMVFPEKFLIVDEAQDLNEVMEDIIRQQCQRGKEIIPLGDPYQAINGWNGAVNSLERLGGARYNLSLSHRFSPEVAAACSKLLNIYFGEAQPVRGSGVTKFSPINQDEPFTIVTRTNAGVFSAALQQVLQGRKIYIQGLEDTIEEEESLEESEVELAETTDDEKFKKFFQPVVDVYHLYTGELQKIKSSLIRSMGSIEKLRQMAGSNSKNAQEYNICLSIVDEYKDETLARLREVQKNLVHKQEKADVIVTTTHKAKGLEWDNVMMWHDFPPLFDSFANNFRQVGLDRKRYQIHPEEIRLLYVAMTRGKKTTQMTKDLQHVLSASDHMILPHKTTAVIPPAQPIPQKPSLIEDSTGNVVSKNEDSAVNKKIEEVTKLCQPLGIKLPLEVMEQILMRLPQGEHHTVHVANNLSELKFETISVLRELEVPVYVGTIAQLPRISKAQEEKVLELLQPGETMITRTHNNTSNSSSAVVLWRDVNGSKPQRYELQLNDPLLGLYDRFKLPSEIKAKQLKEVGGQITEIAVPSLQTINLSPDLF